MSGGASPSGAPRLCKRETKKRVPRGTLLRWRLVVVRPGGRSARHQCRSGRSRDCLGRRRRRRIDRLVTAVRIADPQDAAAFDHTAHHLVAQGGRPAQIRRQGLALRVGEHPEAQTHVVLQRVGTHPCLRDHHQRRSSDARDRSGVNPPGSSAIECACRVRLRRSFIETPGVAMRQCAGAARLRRDVSTWPTIAVSRMQALVTMKTQSPTSAL